jgi:hypothetical protein
VIVTAGDETVTTQSIEDMNHASGSGNILISNPKSYQLYFLMIIDIETGIMDSDDFTSTCGDS